MSYLVLARKYRPQTFADLVGQEQVSRTLKNALTAGRVAHAYLFAGPRGVGKTTAARLLAMALSCLEEDVARRPCGRCESCLEIQAGQAVDVIEVDGASNRGINEIRDLRETVKYLPAKSRYKVYIIDEVHALTKDAFNALLKTLEEPPPHVVFIFATTETHKVLPTILSRCQRYDFRRIRVEDIKARLAQVAELEGLEAEPAALEMIARQAEGGLRDSLSLLDQVIAAGGGAITADEVARSLGLIDLAVVRGTLAATLGGRTREALDFLEEAWLRGYDFKDLGQKMLEAVRALALVKVSPGNAALMDLTEQEEQSLLEQAALCSLETINLHFDAWLKFQNDLNRHPQPRWLMEAQVIRLSQLAPLLPLAELAARLSNLLARNPPPRPPAGRPPAPAARVVPPPEAAAEEPPPAVPAPAPGAVDSWEAFLAAFADRLDDTVKSLLSGAAVRAFGPEAVAIAFPRPGMASNSVKKLLEEKLAAPLTEALGARPRLEFTAPEASGPAAGSVREPGRGWAAEKLAAIKDTQEVKALMERLPGEFVDYRPADAVPEEVEESEEGHQEAAVEDEE